MEKFSHPQWSYTTNIYEVNIRQYTHEGTFKAFKKHLPRLKDMGVEILWFMPVTPISKKDRKGTLGSYYAVQNYTELNPEFGTAADFKKLVKEAHQLGLKIIIDWVANHAGNDNVWIEQQPDFFCYDANKNIVHPNGWEDVVKLNYDDPAMKNAMIDAMKFWITEFDIDGFRCDMAHLVPLSFWQKAKAQLQSSKELFWLAECEEPQYHQVFDATYTWKWMHSTEDFYKNKTGLQTLVDVLIKNDEDFPADAFRVYFTSNHDENSWNGTEYEKYGDAAKLFAVLSCTWNGLPMIYSGQELPNLKRLQFFDKDYIDWEPNLALHNFYKTLFALRKRNASLRAGDATVSTFILNTGSVKLLAYLRKNGDDEVVVVLNFSNEKIDFQLPLEHGIYRKLFDNMEIDIAAGNTFNIIPWGYGILEKIN